MWDMRLNRNVALGATAALCVCALGSTTTAAAQQGLTRPHHHRSRQLSESITSVARSIAASGGSAPGTRMAVADASAGGQNTGDPELKFAPPPMARDTAAVNQLRTDLNDDINGYGGINSALVIDETTNRTLWDTRIAAWRLPASVEKLYTTTTGLLKFGPDWRTQTRVYGDGTLTSGTFEGTLYLQGGGDPTFGSSSFDHANYGTGATVQQLAAKLKAAGIKSVDGHLVGISSLFDNRLGGPSSNWQASIWTEGVLSALTYNAGWTNSYELALVRHPALVATQQLAAAMKADGIRVSGYSTTSTGNTPAQAKLISSVNSPNYATLMELTNSPSDNFFAETLDKQLGKHFGAGGSTLAGAGVVRAEIARVFHLHPWIDDGSGLSRYDRTTAEQVMYLFRRMQNNATFWNSLAIAGRRGTLVDEMLHSRAVNNCRGKTGTLHDVANLVGYCKAANGDKIVFAFLMNGLSNSEFGHQLEGDAGIALANYRG